MINPTVATTFLGLLLPTLISAHNPNTPKQRDDVPGTIELPLTLVESGAGEGPQYLVNISIGTPPQEVTVQIDTGSSDLWVFANDNVCDNSYGCLGSSFDVNASSTLVNDLPGNFAYSYGSGANGTGDYVTDSIQIGGQTIENARFGIAHASSGISPLYGIMGLGFPSGEFAVTQNLSEYNTTVMTMANQGVINSAAFSLYLNDLESQGNILFGGYDQAKYVGDLQTVELLDLGDYEQYYVNLTALGVSSLDSTTNSSSTTWYSNTTVSGAAFIDCGSPKMYLPAGGSINAIYSLGGEYDSDLTYSLIPCSAANDTTSTVDIQLGPGDAGPLVKIHLSELVEPYLGEDSGNVTVNGEDACSFGLSPGPDGFQVLGDAFIRGVYILFNMKEHTVSMAQAKYGVEERDIVAV